MISQHGAPVVSNDNVPCRLNKLQGRLYNIFTNCFHIHLEDHVRVQIYPGAGTHVDPYIISYLPNDVQDAMAFPRQRKWTIAILQALTTFAVTFASSAYASGIDDVATHFDVSAEVATLGVSLYVLGFALGPLVWAPLSEMYGRRSVFVVSYTAYVVFSVAAACAPSIGSLLAFRFLASAFGSSTMTNTVGMIADMFSKTERGLATALFATAPFLGPAFGPISGSFLGETKGWRWILGLVAIMSGVIWIAATAATLETYAPFILRSRARALSRVTGNKHVSRVDAGRSPKTLSQELRVSLTRPWVLLFREPIVFLTSLYVAIVYGTLYMFFSGFPIVFQKARGWNQGVAGLAFVGVAVGVCLATLAASMDNKRYARICAAADAEERPVEPEARLSTAMIGSIVLPIGLFLFAFTTYPSVHWIAPVIGGMLFSCGLVMVFISFMSYLIDSYVIYAASVLASNSLLRSLFGAAFPLFATPMYDNLGIQWASAIPAFLVLGCLPFPFLFYRYGRQIRLKCKYASEAAKTLELMRHRHLAETSGDESGAVKNQS